MDVKSRLACALVAASAWLPLSGACTGDRVVIGTRMCPDVAGGPPAVAPQPSARQLELQRLELTAYIHFGLATFDQGPTPPASAFNPTNLDVREWVTELKSAGFRQVVLVAKHQNGFCLWPSAYTDYSVKSSPWKEGRGDVVMEFTEAMHAAGLPVGLYLSPLDNSFPSTSPDYELYLRNQVTELLSNYGPVAEIAFPGFHAPTTLNWAGIAQLARELQPDIVVWSGPEIATSGVDARYLGNLMGGAARSTSSVADVPNGGPSNVWYPAEAEATDRPDNAWFWTPTGAVMPLSQMESIYFTSVGRNTILVFNVPPAASGQFDTKDLELLRQFGTWYGSLYQTNLLHHQPITSDTTWESPGFDAAKAVDDDICTRWAAASGSTSARLEVTPRSPITFKVISIREPIETGERASAYHVEIRQNGVWNQAPLDASGATIAGTVIGQRQLWQLDPTTADAIALVIDAARGVPAIAELGAY
jgi:alpha-L-fucosidase